MTHAEYSQVVKARVAVHRGLQARMCADQGSGHRLRNDRVPTMAREDPPAPLARWDPAARRPVDTAARISGASGARGLVDASKLPLAPVRARAMSAMWDTAKTHPTVGKWRRVRRYAVWYGNGLDADERIVASVPLRSGKWRECARADACAVVQRLAARGVTRVHKGETTIDRRPRSGDDGIVRAEALCVYAHNGEAARAPAAHCVTLTDDDGRTLAGLIYLPIDDE